MNQTTLLYVNLWLHKWYVFTPCANRETTCIPFVYNKKKEGCLAVVGSNMFFNDIELVCKTLTESPSFHCYVVCMLQLIHFFYLESSLLSEGWVLFYTVERESFSDFYYKFSHFYPEEVLYLHVSSVHLHLSSERKIQLGIGKQNYTTVCLVLLWVKPLAFWRNKWNK